MKQKHKLLSTLLFDALKRFPANEKNSFQILAFVFLLLVFTVPLIVLSGHETMKIICRKNMGKDQTQFGMILFSALTVAIYALLIVKFQDVFPYRCYFITMRFSHAQRFAYAFTGMFYTYLTLILLRYSIFKKYNFSFKIGLPKPNENDSGTSRFFSRFENEKNKQAIQHFWEPATLLLFGLTTGYLYPLFGLPIALCAISYWIIKLIDSLRQENDSDFKSRSSTPNDTFTNVE